MIERRCPRCDSEVELDGGRGRDCNAELLSLLRMRGGEPMSQTATQRLRKLLDERGVEYRKRKDQKGTSLCDITWWGEPGDCEYIDFGMGRSRFVAYDITPEQAIAATLGSGKLTAEQVKKAIGCNCEAYAVNWQAIADELNATLGSGTCDMEEDVGATQTLLTCSECGYTTRDYHPSFCGGCGAKVRKAVSA